MSVLINGLLIILFLVYLFWTWNSTKGFEGKFSRVAYTIIGTIVLILLTYIIFIISKKGIIYPHREMSKLIRNIILLIFVPINGFITLPHIANTIEKIKKDEFTGKQFKTRLIIFIILIIVVFILECFYFNSIQNRIIQIFKLR